MHPRLIAVKRPRDQPTPDTILFESVPYSKRVDYLPTLVQPPAPFFYDPEVSERKRTVRECDEAAGRRQRLRIDAVDEGVVYASIPSQQDYEGDYETEEYCPCEGPPPEEPTEVECEWGQVRRWHDEEDPCINDPHEHDSNEEGQDYPSDESDDRRPSDRRSYFVPRRQRMGVASEYDDYDAMDSFL